MTPPVTCPFGADLQEFWEARHELFSRFDEGIRIDHDGLFAVKTEAAALDTARLLPGPRVFDAFCGVGGSAIAFAREGRQVVTADLDPTRLEMARHNAGLYGVADRIRFVHADVFDLLRTEKADAVYFDAPWGGLAALDRERFTLDDFRPSARRLLEAALPRFPAVAMTVPPHFDFRDLHALGVPWFARARVLRGEVVYHDVFLNVPVPPAL